MSKAKRLAEKTLRVIDFEPAPLSKNKGRCIPTCSPLTRKDRRHSGHRIVCINDNDYPVQFDTYDDWSNHRDGMRDRSSMRKNIYIQMSWYNDELYNTLVTANLKYRKHEKIRKAKKIKERLRKLASKIKINLELLDKIN